MKGVYFIILKKNRIGNDKIIKVFYHFFKIVPFFM